MKILIGQILSDSSDQDNNTTENLLNLILLPLKFLVKHVAFENEQECRICYITSLKDEDIQIEFNKKWLYINYPEKVKTNIKFIYVAAGAREHYPFIIKLLDGDAEKVRMSENPFRAR